MMVIPFRAEGISTTMFKTKIGANVGFLRIGQDLEFIVTGLLSIGSVVSNLQPPHSRKISFHFFANS